MAIQGLFLVDCEGLRSLSLPAESSDHFVVESNFVLEQTQKLRLLADSAVMFTKRGAYTLDEMDDILYTRAELNLPVGERLKKSRWGVLAAASVWLGVRGVWGGAMNDLDESDDQSPLLLRKISLNEQNRGRKMEGAVQRQVLAAIADVLVEGRLEPPGGTPRSSCCAGFAERTETAASSQSPPHGHSVPKGPPSGGALSLSGDAMKRLLKHDPLYDILGAQICAREEEEDESVPPATAERWDEIEACWRKVIARYLVSNGSSSRHTTEQHDVVSLETEQKQDEMFHIYLREIAKYEEAADREDVLAESSGGPTTLELLDALATQRMFLGGGMLFNTLGNTIGEKCGPSKLNPKYPLAIPYLAADDPKVRNFNL